MVLGKIVKKKIIVVMKTRGISPFRMALVKNEKDPFSQALFNRSRENTRLSVLSL